MHVPVNVSIEGAYNRVCAIPPLAQEKLPFPERPQAAGPPRHVLSTLLKNSKAKRITSSS